MSADIDGFDASSRVAFSADLAILRGMSGQPASGPRISWIRALRRLCGLGFAVAAVGCVSNAGGNNGATAASAREAGAPPRPPDAEQDASYYATRSKAFASARSGEIDRTDFRRFRRGRLYARSTRLGPHELALQSELASASANGDFSAVLTLTAKAIANDPSDIHSHMLRMIALEDSQRSLEEAEFHRGMARALLRSILSDGDGRDFDSAWTAFRVSEEYAVLRALGYRPESQALLTRGERSYDVLEARKLETGESTSLHFDITELYDEERRLVPPSAHEDATRTPPSAARALPSRAPALPAPIAR